MSSKLLVVCALALASTGYAAPSRQIVFGEDVAESHRKSRARLALSTEPELTRGVAYP